MKSYTEFLNEVGYAEIPGKGATSWVFSEPQIGKDIKLVAGAKRGKGKIIATGPVTGGKWVLATAPFAKEWKLFAVGGDGTIQLEVVLKVYKKSSYEIESLIAVQGNTIKADDLYAAFIRSGRIIVGTAQSPGGRAVWSKLSAQKGVVVYGWDPATNAPINLGPRYKMDNPEIHVDPSDYADMTALLKANNYRDTAENKPYREEFRYLNSLHIMAAPRDTKLKIHPPGK